MAIGNPHAVGIATRGIATVGASTVGLTSKGYLVRIGESIYIPPTIPPIFPDIPTPHGGGGIPDLGEYKRVVVTVFAYGEKYVTTHIVDKNAKLTIEDVEIVDNGTEIVEVTIRNLRS
ncbi:MAG: hypothetical protein DRR06_19925, partial [Gammaproteobacteria bacterium]